MLTVWFLSENLIGRNIKIQIKLIWAPLSVGKLNKIGKSSIPHGVKKDTKKCNIITVIQ